VFIKLTPAVIGNVVGPAESEKDILDFVIFIVDIVAPALTAAAVVLAAVVLAAVVLAASNILLVSAKFSRLL